MYVCIYIYIYIYIYTCIYVYAGTWLGGEREEANFAGFVFGCAADIIPQIPRPLKSPRALAFQQVERLREGHAESGERGRRGGRGKEREETCAKGECEGESDSGSE